MGGLLRSPAVQEMLAGLAARYIRFCAATTRWDYRGLEHVQPYWRDNRPLIGAFWHGRLCQMTHIWRTPATVSMLISQSRDGQMIARAIEKLGFGTVRGSAAKRGQAKGGEAAVRQIVELVERGVSIGITPDGPRGPRMRASKGVAAMALLTGAPIFAASWSVTNGRLLDTWDRMLLPLPFGRGVFIIAPPIPAEGDEETLRLRVEAELNRITREADAACGRATPEPA